LVGLVLGLSLGSGCNGGDDEGEPIKIAILAPTSGALREVGNSFVRVAAAAVDEINDQGGVAGHPLRLVVKNTATDPDTAAMVMREAIEVDGVVAVVGPASSDAVTTALAVALELETPMISPSSTAPSLSTANDGGYMFRNVPDDSIQGIVQAWFLALSSDGPQVSSAAIIHERGSYGEELAGTFEAKFEAACGNCDVPETHKIQFDRNLANNAAADPVIAALDALTPAPSVVVLVALEQDGLKIVRQWDANSSLTGLQFFMTDGARSLGFLGGIPDSIAGMRGTAPTIPLEGPAFGILRTAYEKRNADKIEDQVFAPNVWDAFHLIGAALAKQKADGEGFGGPGLRDAITDVSRGPGQIFHAGQWGDLMAAIGSGSDVDYDGAAGPNNFDDNGQAISPYEVWEIQPDGTGGYTFGQVVFLKASDVEGLIGGGN
jgi:ABC-type branched-subunit amino acid transport system substrate-binding protein